ncbi:MAG: hypothetical protein CR966_01235 [Pseudomonadales bacterium]|nr:MAG: hypothetical protein CR966_01235 [Pseudomonadales bacterium]
MNLNSIWQALTAHPEFVAMATIPFVTAFVTWVHVWMALKMLFYPIHFKGIRIENMPLGLPGIGWQGIVPHKAGKISGVIVDQTLSKLGSLDEFFQAMDPEEMAEFITKAVDEELESLIDEIMNERSANLWRGMPYAVKRRIYAHVRAELPQTMKGLVVDLTTHVEELVDMRQMIVNKMENDRKLMVNMFIKVGQKELDFIWHISAVIGLFFGIVQMFLYWAVPVHETVPIFAMIWGFITNWIAIWMVFNPIYPHHFSFLKLFRLKIISIPVGKLIGTRFNLPFLLVIPVIPHIARYNWQGGFMKRQEEVSEVFAGIVVRDLVTIEVIMNEMMYGNKALKTRELMKSHLYEMLESPIVNTTLKVGLGRREFGQLKNTILDKSIDATMTPIRDPELNSSRANKIFGMFRDRIRALSPKEFQNLLRPAFQEDETTLIILGGLTGFVFGWIHLALVFY